MSGTCKECANDLAGKVEIETGICTTCLSLRSLQLDKLNADAGQLQRKLDLVQKDLDAANEKIKKYEQLMRAETQGVMAADRGVPMNQNPYPDGTELCVMWLNGWQAVETRRVSGRTLAAVKWAVEALDVVNQLALAAEQGEISGKVSTVQGKLAEQL